MILRTVDKAHVIYTIDGDFIRQLDDSNLSKNAERAYYSGSYVVFPPFFDPQSVPDLFQIVKNPVGTSSKFALNRFTSNAKSARKFRYEEVYDVAKRLQSQKGPKLEVEFIDEELLPF